MSFSLDPVERTGGETAGRTDLIIPDIHLQWTVADRIIQQEKCDRVWLLGDYFDDYGDTLDQVEQTCEFGYSVLFSKVLTLFIFNELFISFIS